MAKATKIDYESFVGKILEDRYVLKQKIGEGGTAVVFRAEDQFRDNLVVAIKILKVDAAANETTVKRFHNEGVTISELKHKNIVDILDVRTSGKLKYMVMEYLRGYTLKEYLMAKKKLDFDEIIGYSSQILRALSAAHEKDIIHRDIKPQNIMLLLNGKIKVMDFGAAKRPDVATLTATNNAVGTVYYMSPEQAKGLKSIDTRSDIYSLGAMMYELATGDVPFRGKAPMDILNQHIKDEPTPPREINSKIPIGLEQIILCAMSKDPADRFQSAEEMLGYVKQLQANKKIKFYELPSNSFWQNLWGRIRRIFEKEKKDK